MAAAPDCLRCGARADHPPPLQCDQCLLPLCLECNRVNYYSANGGVPQAPDRQNGYIVPCLGGDKVKCNWCWVEFCGEVPARFCHACVPRNDGLCGQCHRIYADRSALTADDQPCDHCGDAVRICRDCATVRAMLSTSGRGPFLCENCGEQPAAVK